MLLLPWVVTFYKTKLYELKRAKENVNFISFNVTLTELRQVLADEETLLWGFAQLELK